MKKLIVTIMLIGFSSGIIAQNLQEELGKLYSNKQYELVIQRTDELLNVDSTNSLVNLIRGRTLVDIGKYNEGMPFLKRAVFYDKDNTWRKAWGLGYLGIVNYRQESYGEAKKCFETCLLMNSTQTVNKLSKGLLMLLGLDNFYNDWKIHKTDNFNFYFQHNTVVLNIDSFATARESVFHKINELFQVKIPKKIDFIVWNENEDAQKNGIPKLGFARPKFCLIHSKHNQTLGHEITHIISHYYSENSKHNRFIDDGISVAFDLSGRDFLDIAKAAIKKEDQDGNISIEEIWLHPKMYSENIYYPLAGELVKRLMEQFGNEKFLKLVKNQSIESAKEIYGDKLQLVINKMESELK